MLLSIGKWYPEAMAFISYDDSIAYTMDNIKMQNEKSQELSPFLQLQLPQAINNLDLEKTIPQSENIVNRQNEKITNSEVNSMDIYTNKEDTQTQPEQNNIDEGVFEYQGYHFKPVGVYPDDTSYLQVIAETSANEEPFMSNYEDAKIPYDYMEFYKASGAPNADIFLCVETGNVYIPGNNELFGYKGEYNPYVAQVPDITENDIKYPTKDEVESKGGVIVHDSIKSAYSGYNVFTYEKNGITKVYMGKPENYKEYANGWYYDNSDNSLVYISDNSAMKSFLNYEKGFHISQQEAIARGTMTTSDFIEYDSLRKGILKQFGEAPLKFFGIDKYGNGGKEFSMEYHDNVINENISIPEVQPEKVTYGILKNPDMPGLMEDAYMVVEHTKSNEHKTYDPLEHIIYKGSQKECAEIKDKLTNKEITVDAVKELSQAAENKAKEEKLIDEFKTFEKEHKEAVKAAVAERTTIVINAFAGPGAGKTVACMDICAELKKAGYNAEYVQEYAKELVYEENMEMLNGSLESQWKIFKEQVSRVDRLIGKTDFIVTDSPALLSPVYLSDKDNHAAHVFEMTAGKVHDHYKNFSFFLNRDTSSFQEEGRIHNLEESKEKDKEIKGTLKRNNVFCCNYSRDSVDKIAKNAETTFKRMSEKQKKQLKKRYVLY